MGKHTKKPISLRMTDDEAALLERMAQKHGGKSAAIVQGLKRLEGSNELTDAELISTLKQRLERKNVATFATSDATGPMSQKPVKGNDVSQKIITPPKR